MMSAGFLLLMTENLVGIVTETDITKIYPAMVDVLYEKTNIEEMPVAPERRLMQGRCEECDNMYDDLVEVDGAWLCMSCSKKHAVISSKRQEF